MRMRTTIAALVFLVALLLGGHAAMACPSCYGAPDSPMTEGMNMAIMSLLGITGAVLAGFVAFFVYLRRRAHMFRRMFSQRMN